MFGLFRHVARQNPVDHRPLSKNISVIVCSAVASKILFSLELLNASLVDRNTMNLRAKHDRSEKQEEQSFEAEDERDYDSDWRSEICAALPLHLNAHDRFSDGHEQCISTHHHNIKTK